MQFKVVLDTSTIVSAFFWDGNESELFKKVEEGKIKLYITKEILDEIADVITRPKFRKVMLRVRLTAEQIIEKIISVSQLIVAPKMDIKVCRDEKDNKFLECAEIIKADYIVSGDDDLLSLKKFGEIPILKTSEILKLV